MPRVVPSQVVELIDQLFPEARMETEGGKKILLSKGTLFKVAGIVNLVEQIPPELMILNSSQFSEYATSVASMKTMLGQWQFQGDYSYTVIPGLRKLSPVTLIRQGLAVCPDEFPATDTAELSFISDEKFRSNLRIDYSAVNNALSNSEWKAATVLGGSVVEALLLWALQQRDSVEVQETVKKLVTNKVLKDLGGDLNQWHLSAYIEVAAELKVIGQATATQAKLAKDYRNLIHPGRVERLGQVCNRGTALTTVAALVQVVDDLTP